MAKILLVEDDKSLREIYGVRLSAEGYEIVSAGDGEEALAMAIKERPDLIVSDVMMPKISGFDMLDILRSTSETKDVKVIMMTALSSDDQRARGEALGADRYLVKSQVGIEDVVRTVHDVLQDGIGASAAPSAPATPAPSESPEPIAEPALSTVEPASLVTPPEPTAAPAQTPLQPVEAFSPAPAPQATQIPQPAPTPTVAPSAPLEPATAPVFMTQPVADPVPTPAAQPAPAPEPVAQAPAFKATPVSTTLSELPGAAVPTAAAQPIPATAPSSVPGPAPIASAPVQSPTAAPAPQTQPFIPQTPAPTSPLPQPTAPFSSPAPASLGERVIQPLTTPTNNQADIAQQIEQALSGAPIPPAPSAEQPPVPPAS